MGLLRVGRFLAVVLGLFASVLPCRAAAQVSLTGDFIRYVWTGATGSMISGSESMQYQEDAASGSSCDAFYPGSPVEQFSIEATGARTFIATNTYYSGEISTTDGPRVDGRTIVWSGSYSSGADSIAVDQVLEMESDARLIRMTITVTNTGATELTDFYYMRDADPDHGSGCTGGTGSSTDNDVRRQFPLDTSALVVAGAQAGAYYYIGLGTFDERAVVSAGGFANTEPSVIHGAPTDPEGASEDISFDVVFLEPSLPAGASTTFELFYVWGTTVEEVEDRFDTGGGGVAGPCDGLPELAACTTARGVTGTCHASVCCTGCWDGTRCVGGRSSTACGLGGRACASCTDGDDCSSDVCTAGACGNPDAPRGTRCDDGLFCTRTDTCDGMRRCGGAGDACDDASACTIDTCDEAADSCANTVTPDRCVIGGECVAEGASHPSYPCLLCDPARNARDWSARPEGTSCGEARCAGGRLTTESTCSTTGACLGGVPTRCAVGYCADALSCAFLCAEGECPGSSFCAPSGECELRRANASSCGADAECESGQCVDGICCGDACEGSCESCIVPGSVGSCVIVPAMTDPDGECGALGYCDGLGACSGGDAGMGAPDAGPPSDAASPTGNPDAWLAAADSAPGSADAGATMPVSTPSGCGCRVSGTSGTPGWGLGAALGLGVGVVLAGRRRSRR